VKLSKAAKARIKRMTAADKKSLLKMAAHLADCEVISNDRYMAVRRACNGGM